METTYGLAFGDYHSGDSRLPPDLVCAEDGNGADRLLKLYFPKETKASVEIKESVPYTPDELPECMYFCC